MRDTQYLASVKPVAIFRFPLSITLSTGTILVS